MPIDEKRLEQVKFYNPNASRGRKIKFEHVMKWRGDHSRCAPGHHDKRCVAAGAWLLHGGTLKVSAHIVPVSIEEGAMGMVEYPGQKGKYPKSIAEAKGWRDAEEADPAVRPTDEVLDYVLTKAVRSKKATVENRGAKYEEVEAVVAKFRADILKANGVADESAHEPKQKAARNG